MAPHPSEQPTQAQLEYMLKFRRIDVVQTVAVQVIRWGVLLGLGRYFYLTMAVLAGKQTLADIVIRLLANIKIGQGVAYLFDASGIIYGYGERRLRQKNIQRLAKSKNELERKLNPTRTSSNLSPRGTTRPGDER